MCSLLASLGIRHIDDAQTYRQAKHWQNKIQKFKSHLEHPPNEWASGFYPPFFNSGPDYQAEREGAREMMGGSSGQSRSSIYIYSFNIAHSFRSSIKETQNNSIVSLNISHRKQRQWPYCCIIKDSLVSNFQNSKKLVFPSRGWQTEANNGVRAITTSSPTATPGLRDLILNGSEWRQSLGIPFGGLPTNTHSCAIKLQQ